MIRFLPDENVNGKIVRGLRARQPDVDMIRVQDTELSGVDDPAVLEWAAKEGRILLTHDLDTIENMGYAKHLQQPYDERRREEEELLSELAILEALQVDPRQIAHISDEALEGWICYMREALECEDKALVRRIIQQFVAKIVIKEGTGTLYYTLPFPNDRICLGFVTWT